MVTPASAAGTTAAGRYALLRQLRANGIDCLFGNPGSTEENLLDALHADEFSGLQYYLALHEGPAVAMADAYARASGKPAVVQLHSYAGLANGLGMIYYARRGHTPMVVLAGEAGLRYDALEGQMSSDLVTMARPFVKADANGPCAWRVLDTGSLLRLVRRALKVATTPPCGPVLLVLPMDVLDEVNDEAIVPAATVVTRVLPDVPTISRAADLLRRRARPLILVGDGIAASHAQAALIRVAELLGAVVWGGNSSEINMPAAHPLYAGDLGHMFGSASQPILSRADAVLVCGTTVLPEVFPSLQGVFADDAAVVHIDLNGYEIGKNHPVLLGAIGDPRLTLDAIADELERTLSPQERRDAAARVRDACDRQQSARARAIERDAQLRDAEPLHMTRFATELASRWQGGLIFDEALTNSAALRRYLPLEVPGTYYQTRAGMLGTGLPGAVGLKVARPDQMVFGFSGDGGSISTIQALATAARHNIGAKFVVCNNRSYRILKYNLQEYRAERGQATDQPVPVEFDLQTPLLRFDLLADAQGVPAVRVERACEIGPALDRALGDDRPFLIDLVLTSEL
jgi:thiamine pyrophosphate-dependent acetolactate synthase large subunit-like protein